MGIRVVELFAGVGGFRLGLEAADQRFETVWWNQWEPSTRVQHAWRCYVEGHHGGDESLAPAESNMDICQVPLDSVPRHDLLVGGFPCQDYSVATTLDKAGGLQGKKGVLWWRIEAILEHRKPDYVLLENVDRLLKSPADKRGRDFGVLLACLHNLGYRVEWRVINAAEYGNAQKRRRVFIFAAHERTAIGRHIASRAKFSNYLYTESFFAQEFPLSYETLEVEELPPHGTLEKDVREVSSEFEYRFQNTGVMVDGAFWTRNLTAKAEDQAVLGKHVERGIVDERYFLDPVKVEGWKTAKGSKSFMRTAKNGHVYRYSEGAMQFPDLRTAPARTILTSEGNRTPNRSTHVITDVRTDRLRFLTPLEVERLMGFPSGWTANLPERWRYFTMGNALVVPLVERMGRRLVAWIEANEPQSRRQKLLGTKEKPDEERLVMAHRGQRRPGHP